MPIDFSGSYKPPGVYIQELIAPAVTAVGLPVTTVALVGPSLGYQTNTETITIGSTPVTLSKKGVNPSSITAVRVDNNVAVAGSDLATTMSGAVLNSQDYTTTIALANGATTQAGTLLYVTYNYTPPDYYTLKQFDNFQDVQDHYGVSIDVTNVVAPTGAGYFWPVVSPVSLAAQFAFANGAGSVVILPTAPLASGLTTAQVSTAQRTNLQNAYATLSGEYSVDVIVPITSGIADADAAGAAQDLKSHVENASNDSYFRVGILGLPKQITSAPDTFLSQNGIRSKRVAFVFAASGGLNYYNGGVNQTMALGHQYLAAAVAGRMAANPMQKPLTREIIQGFQSITGTPLPKIVKNQYSTNGVMVLESDRLGRLVIRHGVATDPTSIYTRELSLTRAKDAMVALLQLGTDASGLIGSAIDFNTSANVKAVVSGLLEQCVQGGVIVDYQNLSVRQQSIDPSVIEVKFNYLPAYPLNYILITFSINVDTGALTGLAA